MALSSYTVNDYVTTSMPEYERELWREHERKQQRYLEEMARSVQLRNGLNESFNAITPSAQKPKLNKVLLLCS